MVVVMVYSVPPPQAEFWGSLGIDLEGSPHSSPGIITVHEGRCRDSVRT